MSEERGSCEREDDEWDERLPATNQTIRGKDGVYSIGRMISRGRFGAVFEVLRKKDGRRFAAKLEICDQHSHGIDMDYAVLVKSAREGGEEATEYLPTMVDKGKIVDHFKFIVMTLMGESLLALRTSYTEDGRFSLSTSLRLALLTLAPIQFLHQLGFVHRDIKASNFVLSADGCKVCLIDFGLCRSFKDEIGSKKMPREQPAQFRGTTRYASLTAHQKKEQSAKDDIESWFYMIIEMISGFLPWSDLHRKDREEVQRRKEHARTSEGMHELLKYCPRTEFRRLMKYVDSLSYQSQPDYNYIGKLIHLSIRNHNISMEESFDWQESD